MKVLIFGGCHTYTFGNFDINDGYVQKMVSVLKDSNTDVKVTAYAPITIKNALNLIVSEKVKMNDFDLVIFQFGNHEFELSISECHLLFSRKYLRKYDISSSKFTKELTPELIKERRDWYTEDDTTTIIQQLKKINSVLFGRAFHLLDNIIIYPRFSWYETLIQDFFENVREYNDKIICLGVFPCMYSFRQALREKGDLLLKQNAMKNGIKFIDLVNSKLDDSYFLKDGVHLNTKGHKFIYEKIVKDVNLIQTQLRAKNH